MDWGCVQAIGTWVGAIGAIGALVFLAKQTISLTRQTEALATQTKSMTASYVFDSQWRRHNKASELALFYAQSLLPRIGYCSFLIEKSDIYPRLKGISPRHMIRFNQAEMKELFCTEENVLDLVRSSMEQVDTTLYLQARRFIPIGFRDEFAERLSTQSKPDILGNETYHEILVKEFWVVTEELLNDLEYFSMCINSGIADGDILYPSLHQTFFNMISAFYFLISSQNTSMRDKYYTHLIRLFTDWKQRLIDHERKESQTEDEISQQYHRVP